MIEIQDLTRQFGDIHAVAGLSLTIPRGQVFGLLGPNGAGKSTTLKTLATLLRPTSGSVRIDGFDVVSQADDVRRIIGYVPEGADLYESLTGAEFLDLVADLHRLDHAEAESRRGTILQTFELLDDLDRPIGSYSKGMKQKLLITAALQHDPAVLLLDEPLDGLDVPAQAALKEIIRRQTAEGCVVYSSHILEVVERVCDRVGVIHHGRMVAQGSPAELMASQPGQSLSDVFLSLTRA